MLCFTTIKYNLISKVTVCDNHKKHNNDITMVKFPSW